MFKDFKEFAMKGSLVDIVVAFLMGAAFKDVVKSFTSGINSLVIGLIFKADFKGLMYILEKGTVNVPGLSLESPLLCGVSL